MPSCKYRHKILEDCNIDDYIVDIIWSQSSPRAIFFLYAPSARNYYKPIQWRYDLTNFKKGLKTVALTFSEAYNYLYDRGMELPDWTWLHNYLVNGNGRKEVT